MSTNEVRSNNATSDLTGARVDFKLEVVVIPVADADRAKEFYTRLGWRLDADFAAGDDFRVIQVHAAWLRVFGYLRQERRTAAAAGSAQGLYMVVSDIEAAREELLGRGVKVNEVFHDAGAVHAGTDEPYLFGRLRVSGRDPEHRSYRSFASFNDPDGNGWLFQEITTRLPGRVAGDTAHVGRRPVAGAAARRGAHGEHEKRIGSADPNWPTWYADYMVREQAGEELPQ